MEDELGKFINGILAAKDLAGVNNDVRIQLVADLKERLLNQINRAIINALPDDKLDEFNNLLDSSDVNDDILQQFIVQSGVDIKRVTTETMLLFRDLYLQTVQGRG